MKEDPEFLAHKAHFGPLSKGMIDFVTNDVLLRSRYLFTKSKNGRQLAYCTHCKHTHYPAAKLKHRNTAKCPQCQSDCTVYMDHVGRKYLFDDAYVVYYEKSIVDPRVVTAKGFYVRRDYTGDYHYVETLYRPSCSYVFQMGNSSMYQTSYFDQSQWWKKKNIRSEYCHYHSIKKRYNREEILQVVRGTPLEYSTWEQYDEQDMTKFFGLYTQYPCIEYLTKMNLSFFVRSKVYGTRTYDAIKWSGKAIESILRLKKKDLRQFMEVYPRIEHGDYDLALALRLYQLTLKDNDRPSIGDLEKIASRIEDCYPMYKTMFKFQSVMKCIQYVDKQYQKGKGRRYRHRSDVLSAWRDYLEQLKQLDLDLNRLEIVFPLNLSQKHDEATEQVKVKLSELEKRKIANRAEDLKRYRFSYDGFIIRAAASADEIIREGKRLRHCVGSYAQSHADGKTNILVIRKAGDPDEPFFTMELKDGQIKQVYGYRHSLPANDVARLIEAFKKEKLKKRSGKKKPVKVQEVAV